MSRCSVLWSAAGLPAWGTAARADFWVCLETPGPWGAKAATSARSLDPAVGARLEALIEEMGGRLLLIRRAARNTVGDDPLTVLVSGGFDEEGWLTRFEVDDAQALVEWLESWRQAGTPPPPDTVPEPVLLVCTHAKRDRCCALEGRPILEELEGELGSEPLWECSHLGGHRFAPTALLLPTGQVLGRMGTGEALAAYRDAGVGLLWPGGERRDRGRSHLPPERQAAEAWALARFGAARSLDLGSRMAGDVVQVRHGERRVSVRVSRVDTGDEAPLSCGKESEPMTYWAVEPVRDKL
ncbi:MAG TPA: sucrase ferredoxin [Arachnia sp.]|nr:sucrase ferredoxin [Arachnia sp.]